MTKHHNGDANELIGCVQHDCDACQAAKKGNSILLEQQDKIELSKRVAEKYELLLYYHAVLLADDDARCFMLAVDNEVIIDCRNECVDVSYVDITTSHLYREKHEDHPDKYEATRIAILKCLDAMKG